MGLSKKGEFTKIGKTIIQILFFLILAFGLGYLVKSLVEGI